MSTRLEDFVDDNRDEFDSKSPSDKVWNNIEGELAGKHKKAMIIQMPMFKWAIAAASVFIIGSILYLQLNQKSAGGDAIVKHDQEINKLVPEYAPQVNEFAKLINLKQEELKLLAKETPQLYKKFTTDITQLDSSYNALKSQLSINPNKEMLIEAMIQNLQLQLNVLNQQLNIIKQIKQSKEYSHEKNYQEI